MKKAANKTEPMIQYVLFTILVVMTPFVVVTKFLQGAVYNLSHMSFSLFGIQLPFIGTAAIALIIAIIIWQRKYITRRSAAAILVIIAMIALSQWVQDLYGGMSVYDLQKNWHYAAYGAYVFVFFRAFNRQGVPLQRMIVYSYFSAIGLSIFDETFQLFLSDRIFDVSDIAKDSWGTIVGLILVLFVSQTYGTIDFKSHTAWKRRPRDYFNDPLAALVVCGLLSLVVIMLSPLLTDFRHITIFIGLVIGLYIVVLLIWHFLQFKRFRIAFISLLIIILVTISGSYLKHRNDNFSHNRYGLMVYKGFPVPFFDLMIYPNGLPRLVDKKHFFNNMDRQFMMQQEPDILIIGIGFHGKGGNGFKVKEGPYFVYNRYTNNGTQIIILPTPRACEEFNRLKTENKNVLFIIHTTC